MCSPMPDISDEQWAEVDRQFAEEFRVTKVPGSSASHSIITPLCRTNRSDGGAFDEAVARARQEYDAIVAGWADSPDQPTLHLILTIERP